MRVTVEHDVRIVESLAAVGVPDEAIDVTGIQIATGSGKILTSQDVRITLEIAATPAQLAEVLGILSARQGLAIDLLEWTTVDFEVAANDAR